MGRSSQYNNISSDELLDQINPVNLDLKDRYLNYLLSVDRSPQTIKAYSNDLNIFFIWNLKYNNNIPFVDLVIRHIVEYQGWLIGVNKNSPSRVRRLKATLSSFSNFIETMYEDVYPNFKPIINKVESPALQTTREKTVLTNDVVNSLLETLVSEKKYQHACALALACSNGARKSEILRFKTHYFDDKNIIFGSLYKTPERIKTKGRSSKGKMLYKYTLKNSFEPYLKLWLEEREKKGIDSEWLFVSKERGKDTYKQMSESVLNSWAKQFTNIAKIPFYWHSTRHYFVTLLSKSKIPDSVIKDIVGWESLELVSVYNDQSTDETLADYFDEGGIKQVDEGKLSDL